MPPKGSKRKKAPSEPVEKSSPATKRGKKADEKQEQPHEPAKPTDNAIKLEEGESVVKECSDEGINAGISSRDADVEAKTEDDIRVKVEPDDGIPSRQKDVESTDIEDHVPSYVQKREEEEDDIEAHFRSLQNKNEKVKCPYLDTVNRQALDFDMEKLCSVNLGNRNIYACLVCGKFFAGRGKGTPAYTHSVQCSHFVFMNITADVEENFAKAYCLPDGYEIQDSSLVDIKKCLKPSFTPEEIGALNSNTVLARDVHGVSYLPGFVGLNNLKCTDYVSVVLHALSHVRPIRDFFLNPSNYSFVSKEKYPIVYKFGEVIRKVWSKHNFKSMVSPHDFIQAMTVSSKRKFLIGKQAEAVELMVWLLNELHQGLGGSKKPNSSIIYKTFQGKVHLRKRVKTIKIVSTAEPRNDSMDISSGNEVNENEDSDDEQKTVQSRVAQWVETSVSSPFLILNLEIPATPLFKDSQGGQIIPQIPLLEVLKKYNGETWTDHVGPNGLERKQYSIESLPNYLIFHLGRFTKNNFYLEKNHTIVNFPVKNLEMKDYISPSSSSADNVPVSEKYDLIANICHDSHVSVGENLSSSSTLNSTQQGEAVQALKKGAKPVKSVLDNGIYRIHTRNKATDQWFELQDLHVSETMPQLISISESYMLIYEKKTA